MEYIDFDLRIERRRGRAYPVTLNSPVMPLTRATMRSPEPRELTNLLQAVRIAILESDTLQAPARRVPRLNEQPVQDLGRALFTALFNADIASGYTSSRTIAQRDGKGIRVRLGIDDPGLVVLPWEYLYDPTQGEYLSLARGTALVRYIETQHTSAPPPVSPPIRILGVAASPEDADYDHLAVHAEQQHVIQALAGLTESGVAELVWINQPTVDSLQDAMRQGPWHVLHFVGHGEFDPPTDEGAIVLTRDNGQAHRISATQLGRILAGHPALRLVVLNACEGARGSHRDIFSSTAATLVRRGVPAVLAMQYRINDAAAVQFAQHFYTAVAEGMPVDAAATEARIGISVSVASTVEWGSPVLYMQTTDGILFNISQPIKGLRRSGTDQAQPRQPYNTASPDLVGRIPADNHAEAPKVLCAGPDSGDGLSLRDTIGSIAHEYLLYVQSPPTPDSTTATQAEGRSVRAGLAALLEFMQVGEVRETVGAFQADLKAAGDQIEILGDCKLLHDALHNLQFECYNPLRQELRRSDEPSIDWDSVADYEMRAQVCLESIVVVASRTSVSTTDSQLIRDLTRANLLLREAIDLSDQHGAVSAALIMLKRAVGYLDRLFAEQPVRINAQIIAAARAVRLPSLLRTMKFISISLDHPDLDQDRVRQFELGRDALAQLNEKLTVLVAQHDQWQEIDSELRRIEAMLDSDMTELEQSWPDIDTLTASMYQSREDPWAIELRDSSVALGSAIAAQDPVKSRRMFRRYCQRAGTQFYLVDRQLLQLCEELRAVGDPLAAVLRTMA